MTRMPLGTALAALLLLPACGDKENTGPVGTAGDTATGAGDTVDPIDADGDGYPLAEDCDDSDPSVHPGATETCDGRDEDCDGTVDEDTGEDRIWYQDADGDGWGDIDATAEDCEAPAGHVAESGDCDDSDAAVSPSAPEVCGDGVDNDCDGWQYGCAWSGEHSLAEAETAFLGTTRHGSTAGVAAFGDLDSDGIAEVMVGVDESLQIWRGPLVAGELVSGNSDLVYFGDTDSDIAVGGDLNGDGYQDLAVGDRHAEGLGETGGAVLLFHGSENGLGEGTVELEYDAKVVGEVDQQAKTIGDAVAFAGDTNGDGLADLLIGCATYHAEGHSVYLLNGPLTSGMTDAADATARMFDTKEKQFDHSGAWAYGEDGTLSGAGDLNEDGYDDFVVGVDFDVWEEGDRAGAAFVYFGPVSGDGLGAEDADVGIIGEDAYDFVGRRVAAPGDLNDDGHDDLLASVTRSGEFVAVGLFNGPFESGTFSAWAADTLVVSTSDAGLTDMVGAGDINRDGIDDLLFSDRDLGDGTGASYLFYGPITAAELNYADASAAFVGENQGDFAAGLFDGRGDATGDGVDDMLIGAAGWDNPVVEDGTSAGKLYLLHGRPAE